MQCTNPYFLESGGLYVPCGKCRGCRISRSREWSTRIMHELSYHKNSLFVTLTYNDDHIPSDYSLNKKHFQDFMKRLRRRFDDRPLKYYGCGEYGEHTSRPHYHLILFGLGYDDLLSYRVNSKVFASKYLESIWPFGQNSIGSVTYQSARYVADYIQKDDRSDKYGGRLPPFSLMSQGIGKQFALDNAKQIIQNMDITINGKSVGIPKYYQKVLDIPRDFFIEKAKEREKEVDQKLYERAQKIGSATPIEKRKSQIQRNKNNISRQEMKKKGRI